MILWLLVKSLYFENLRSENFCLKISHAFGVKWWWKFFIFYKRGISIQQNTNAFLCCFSSLLILFPTSCKVSKWLLLLQMSWKVYQHLFLFLGKIHCQRVLCGRQRHWVFLFLNWFEPMFVRIGCDRYYCYMAGG